MYITCTLQAYPVMDVVNPFHKACFFIDGRCEALLSYFGFVVVQYRTFNRGLFLFAMQTVFSGTFGNQPLVSLTPLFNLQAGRLQMEVTGLVTATKQQKITHHPSVLHCNNLSHLLPDKIRSQLPKGPTHFSPGFKRVLEVPSIPC